MNTLYAMLAGFALDMLLGDPRWLPHPVIFMGKAISALEKALRSRFDGERGLLAAGRIIAVVLPLGSFGLSWLVIWLCGLLHPLLALAAEAWMCYQIFAACELRRQSMAVYRRLVSGDLPGARKAVGCIVGRDTDALDETGVAKAAVETVAENASDGVIAPMVFMALWGAPLAMAYKAINTMDSMIGYKNEKYIHLGRAAAKLDDIVNLFPARFSAVCMAIAAPLAGLSPTGAWQVWRRDRLNHASPNSAHTEAACAGALGVQLAGDAVYFGEVVGKPTIGDDTRPLEYADIPRANRLMLLASLLALAICCGARAAVLLIGGLA